MVARAILAGAFLVGLSASAGAADVFCRYGAPCGGYGDAPSHGYKRAYAAAPRSYEIPAPVYRRPHYAYRIPRHGYIAPPHAYRAPGYTYRMPGYRYTAGHGYRRPSYGYGPSHAYRRSFTHGDRYGYETPRYSTARYPVDVELDRYGRADRNLTISVQPDMPASSQGQVYRYRVTQPTDMYRTARSGYGMPRVIYGPPRSGAYGTSRYVDPDLIDGGEPLPGGYGMPRRGYGEPAYAGYSTYRAETDGGQLLDEE